MMDSITWSSRVGYGLSKVYSMYDNFVLKAEIVVYLSGRYSCNFVSSSEERMLLKSSKKITFDVVDTEEKLLVVKQWLKKVYLSVMQETTLNGSDLKKKLKWGAPVDIDELALKCLCNVVFSVEKLLPGVSKYDIDKFNKKVCSLQDKIKELV